MNEKIQNFEKLTDREILLLTCQRVHGHHESIIEQEKRISKLEHFRIYLTGFAGAVTAYLGFRHK